MIFQTLCLSNHSWFFRHSVYLFRYKCTGTYTVNSELLNLFRKLDIFLRITVSCFEKDKIMVLHHLFKKWNYFLDWHSRSCSLQTFREWNCILHSSPANCTPSLLLSATRSLHRHHINVFGWWRGQWQGKNIRIF